MDMMKDKRLQLVLCIAAGLVAGLALKNLALWLSVGTAIGVALAARGSKSEKQE